MAGATNTLIQILRSDTTAYPASLNPGEQAYSFVSDKLFVGNTTNGVLTIGGKYYTDLIDNATSANTGNTIVRRDVDGNAAFTMVTIDDAPSNSTDAVNKGYLEQVVGGLSSNTIYEGTLGAAGYSNVHTSNTESGGSVHITANNNVVAHFTNDIITFNRDIEISGNLNVLGNTTQIDVQTLNISDPLIYLAGNNYTSDIVDIGFVGNYFDGSTQRHTGVFRHADNKEYYIFDNYTDEPTANVITPGSNDFRIATLNANISAQLVTSNVANVQLLDFWEKGQISNPALSSGDGGTYSTLVLKPDTDLATDQFIVIDPTTPNHIHVRAGGTIDSSTADLFVGGEETNVLVSDGSKTVTIKANSSHSWIFENEGYLTLPHGTTLTTYSNNSIALLKAGSTACTTTISSVEGFYVDPVRNASSSNIMFYDDTTKEITYGAAAVDSAEAANVAYYGNVTEATGAEVTRHTVSLFHGVSGNSAFQANTLFTFDTSNTTLEVGYSAYTPLPNTMLQTTGSSYNYVQNNLQNLNNNGSADWVVTADNGSDTHGYLDMGMAGGNYDYLTDAGETGPFKANDGWIQVVGNTGQGKGNLIIATGTSNTSVAEVGSIIFSVGNQAYANIAGYITREDNDPTGTLTWAIGKNAGANSAYLLDVAGSANVASLYINNAHVLGEGFGLSVSFGGTGRTSVTANTILYGNGSGQMLETNAPNAGDVLQYSPEGVKFGGLDGGTF